MKEFAGEQWIKAIDITEDKLKQLWVATVNIKPAMKWVVDIICEFYGVKLRELRDKGNVAEIYGIKEEHLNTLIDHSDIGIAYNNFKKQYTWDKRTDEMGAIIDNDISDDMLPKSQNNVDVNLWEAKILKTMKTNERNSLIKMIENESDDKKKELYEAQLVVLDLELEPNG